MGRHQKFTDEELLQSIKNKYQELGSIPKVTDFSNTFSRSILRRFNSYRNALVLAGVINLEKKEIELRNIIKNLYNDTKVIPSVQDLEIYTPIPYQEFYKQFGSWNNALKQAGIKIPKRTKDELLIYLNDLSKWLNRVPSLMDMEKYSIIGSSVYVRTFNSWNNAIYLAKLIPNKLTVSTNSKTDLIKKLQDKYLELGKVPMGGDMHNPSYQTYRLKFGSWDNALKAAGIEKPIVVKPKKSLLKKKKPPKYTKEILIQQFIKKYEELGHTPTISDMKPPYPSYRVYYRHFKTWKEIIEASQIIDIRPLSERKSNNVYEPYYSENILISKLQLLAIDLGRNPLMSEVKNPNATIYKKRFGSWIRALKGAGLLNEDVEEIDRQYSKEELIQYIVKASNNFDKIPSWDKIPRQIQKQCIEMFGTWNKLLKESEVLNMRVFHWCATCGSDDSVGVAYSFHNPIGGFCEKCKLNGAFKDYEVTKFEYF